MHSRDLHCFTQYGLRLRSVICGATIEPATNSAPEPTTKSTSGRNRKLTTGPAAKRRHHVPRENLAEIFSILFGSFDDAQLLQAGRLTIGQAISRQDRESYRHAR